jgi:hypothetical protein
MLRSSYDFTDVHGLYDEDATIGNLESELDWLVQDATPDDRLIFYFSGHGSTKFSTEAQEQVLVLTDGYFEDHRLVAKTQPLPPGICTTIVDACFSGGFMEGIVGRSGTAPPGSVLEVEPAIVKTSRRTTEELAANFRAFVPGDWSPGATRPVRLRRFKRFGTAWATSPESIADILAPRTALIVDVAAHSRPTLRRASAARERVDLNGLLVCACLENEQASGERPWTEGLSAFTHSLLNSLKGLDRPTSASEVLQRTAASMQVLGFVQTPLVLERPDPGNLKERQLVTFDPVGAGFVGPELGEAERARLAALLVVVLVAAVGATLHVVGGRSTSSLRAGIPGTGWNPDSSIPSERTDRLAVY